MEGEAEEIGLPEAGFWSRAGNEPKKETAQPSADHAAAFELVREAVSKASLLELAAVGHRVVHGDPKLCDHFRLSNDALQDLKNAVPFAPLHLPSSIFVIESLPQWG